MAKSLFKKDISPACVYCGIGQASEDGSVVLCKKKGIMQPSSNCKKFVYDPLKRKPQTVKLKTDFSESDFSL